MNHAFLDSNIVVYYYTLTEPRKREIVAIEISDRFNVPYFDSLMVASASFAGCEVLDSEDFQDGQEINGVRIINPFVQS
ncbi:MAG TPA: hypothetical protein VGM92_12625 [Candidatus Kapabacteria bacterium]|jgi:predicted nucleic acid-binding protein